MNSNLFNVLFGCFNQYAFSFAKSNIDNLRYFFQGNVQTCGNPLVESLLDAIEKNRLENIGKPMFDSILTRCCGTQAERDQVYSEIRNFKGMSKEQIEPLKEEISRICSSSILNRAENLYRDDPVGLLKYLRNQNVPTESQDLLQIKSAWDIDINSLVADACDDVVHSSMNFINNSYPLGGYYKGQCVIICMPPGQGKSLFLEQELLNFAKQGEKVWFVALGDINEFDLVTRLCAIYHGVPLREAARPENITRLWTALIDDIGNNINITVLGAGVVSSGDIVDTIKNNPIFRNVSCIGIDYDGNLKVDNPSDNMYIYYGQIYEKFTELTVDRNYRKLLLVASQPKNACWDNNIIRMSDIGESSKKQHHADMIVTAGRQPESNNHVRKMFIAKNRRGETEVTAFTARLNNGETVEIDKAVFDELVDRGTPHYELTRGFIDEMNRRAGNVQGQIRNNYGSASNSYGTPSQQQEDFSKFMKGSKGPSPFQQ